jgi:ketosteroid isomerase-like protein
MSQENVELLYRSYDALNRRDLDAYLALIDPEVEFTPRILQMEGGSYRGHKGIREWLRTLLDAFPDFSSEVLEVREPRRDILIVSIRVRGHGLEGGVPFAEVWWQAIKARDGKAIWVQNFGTEAEALDAVGLSE